MQVRILGASGGISAGLRTTCIVVDQNVLIDCGTGVGDLSMEQMKHITHVFLTHSHIDHTASLPLLIDTLFGEVDHPLRVLGSQETINAIHEHLFNWVMWPDFSELPNKENPSLIFEVIEPSQKVEVNGKFFTPVPVNHVVPTVAYLVEDDNSVFAFSGDTMENDTLWPVLNNLPKLDLLVIETAFDKESEELAKQAGHYSPAALARDLEKLNHACDIWITHLKPGYEEAIFAELVDMIPNRQLHRLLGNELFTL